MASVVNSILSLSAWAANHPLTNLVDNLDDLTHFITIGTSAGFVSNNNDGTVTMWRTNANVDAPYVWGSSGALNQYLRQSTAPIVEIGAVTNVNGGSWLASLRLMGAGYALLGEQQIQSETQATGLQTYTVPTSMNGTNVLMYDVLFRINPIGSSDVGFTFTSISAIPEPSTYAMIGAGALGLLALRRRRV